MVASLQLAGFELLHDPAQPPGSASGYAPTAGSPRYSLLDGWDLGAPAPRVAKAASNYIDGSRQYGRRSDNRAFKLPVAAAVTQADGRTALATAVEALLLAVDQPAYQLLWTPDGGLQNRYDLFRATITHEYQLTLEEAAQAFGVPCLARAFTVSAEALPYAAEVTASAITMPSPLYTIGSAPVRGSAYLLPRDNTGYPGTAPTPLFGTFTMPSSIPGSSSGNILIHHAPIEGGGPAAVIVPQSTSINGGGTVATIKYLYQGNGAAVQHSGTYEVIMVLPQAAQADANLANYVFSASLQYQSPAHGILVSTDPISVSSQPTGEYVSLGYVTLPAQDWGSDRLLTDTGFYVYIQLNIQLSGASASPTWAVGGLPDMLLLDTRGQTVLITAAQTPNVNQPWWIEEPVPPFEVQGKIISAPAASPTHAKASSTLANQIYLAGGAPLQLDPDPRGNVLFVYSAGGPIAMSWQRRDRWLHERTV